MKANRPARSRYLSAFRSPRGIVGLGLVGMLTVIGVIYPLLSSTSPTDQTANALAGLSWGHPLGTDELGRDICSRLIYGLRTDLVITLVAVTIAASIGTVAGLLPVLSERVGNAGQRVFDILIGMPPVILGIALVIALGPGTLAIIVTVVLTTTPMFGRQAATATASLLGRDYVSAAVVAGSSRAGILGRHVLPNVADSQLALGAVAMAQAITIEGAMSVVGLGVVPPAPSLGTMIKDGAPHLFGHGQYCLSAIALVVLLVLGFTLITDALNATVLRK